MNFGDLIAKGGPLFLRKKLSAVQQVFDAAPAGEKAAFQASMSGALNYSSFSSLKSAADSGQLSVGTVYTVTGNITGITGGAFGVQWVWTGSLLRPAGQQTLWHLQEQADGSAGGLAGIQRLASVPLPPEILVGCREIILRTRWLFSGAETNARQLRARLGPTEGNNEQIIASGTATNTWRFVVMSLHASPNGTTGILPTTNAGGSASVTADSWVAGPTAATTINIDLTQALYFGLEVQQGSSPSTQASLSRAWLIVA